MNNVILMGRLTDNPEIKTTSNGIDVISFSIAVDRGYVKAGEQRQADFINCVAWRKTAGFISKYFVKGQLIAVEGSLQVRSYQDKSGSNRYVTEVVIDNAFFTGDKRGNNQGGYDSGYTAPVPQEAPAAVSAYTSGSAGDFEEMPLDDDLPF